MNGIEEIEAPALVSDGSLLSRFLTKRDDAAFAELVARHGPLVFGVCLRRLGQSSDAEDAFQAVFLALANQANELAGRQVLGPWLYTVARRISGKALRSRRRRRWLFWSRPLELQAANPSEVDVDLDAALASLSEDERSAIILCHMEGYSRSEAAKALGCLEGTLSARLSRGLEKLRKKLGKSPLAILTAATVVMLPEALPAMTVASVRHLREGTLEDWASPQTVELYRKAQPMNVLHRAGPTVGAAVAVALVMVGVALGWNLIEGQEPKNADKTTKTTSKTTLAPEEIDRRLRLQQEERDRGNVGGMAVVDAVKKFNANFHTDATGAIQPPLTEDEVVAAIRVWIRDYATIPNEVYEAYQKVADTKRMPPGARLTARTSIVVNDYYVEDWRIKLTLQFSGQKEHDFLIRDQKIRCRPWKEWVEEKRKPDRKNFVYRLKNVSAESVVNVLKQTVKEADVAVAADAATNSVVVSATPARYESVLKVIQAIDALKE